MKFIDYWREFSRCCPLDITDSEMAKHAFETGIQEGIKRKREWVGLTQEELQDLCVKGYQKDNAGETHFNCGYFAEAIEAKLKEKNT